MHLSVHATDHLCRRATVTVEAALTTTAACIARPPAQDHASGLAIADELEAQ